MPPQQAIDVQDTARLRVAGLLKPVMQDECIFSCAEKKSWNDVYPSFESSLWTKSFQRMIRTKATMRRRLCTYDALSCILCAAGPW